MTDIERLQGELEQERLLHAEGQGKDPHGSVMVMQSLLEGAQLRAAGLEREIADLRRDLLKADEDKKKDLAQVTTLQRELESMAALKESEVSRLEEQLSVRPSFEEVEELRQRLRNIDTVELADENFGSTDLERRSLHRQKVLEGHLSESRVRASELSEEAEGLKQQLLASQDEVKDLRQLVRRLEDEINAGQVPLSRDSSGPLAGLEGVLNGFPAKGGGDEAMPSMLEILTGQRDRLRERLGDLEQERDRYRTMAEQAKVRADTIHADNAQLMERIRYFQSLQPKAKATRSKHSLQDDLENRYPSLEDGLGSTSFEQFREEERVRRSGGVHAGERIIMLWGQLLLSSRIARSVTFVYTSALHLLVFLVLIRQAHHSV